MAELLDMGQYALFVWTGWGVTAAAFAAMAGFTIAERRRTRERLKRAQERAGVK